MGSSWRVGTLDGITAAARSQRGRRGIRPRPRFVLTMRAMRTPTWPPPTADAALAVLVSGGLDSAILVGEAVRAYPAVFPLYIRTGLHWEDTEREYLVRFLAAIRTPALRPLVVLDQPVRDLYGDHWSTTGENVPGADTPDDAVFLPGRNVLLLSKSLLWCHLNGVPELAMAHGSKPAEGSRHQRER